MKIGALYKLLLKFISNGSCSQSVQSSSCIASKFGFRCLLDCLELALPKLWTRSKKLLPETSRLSFGAGVGFSWAATGFWTTGSSVLVEISPLPAEWALGFLYAGSSPVRSDWLFPMFCEMLAQVKDAL